MKERILFISLCFCIQLLFPQSAENRQKDSVRKLLFLSRNETSDSIQKLYGQRAVALSRNSGNDSLLVYSLRNLIPLYEEANDSFRILSKEQFVLSHEIEDTASIADACYNLGKYYRALLKVDSSYFYHYEAEKYYKAIGDNWNTAQVLLSIANMQRDEKDFTGSEIISFEALSYLDKLPDVFLYRRKKAFVYNNLGLVFHQLGQYDQAIKYHQQALKIKNSLDGDNTYTIDISKSNIANVFRDKGDYEKANFYNEDILNRNEVRRNHPDFYALVLDNYAYTHYLSGKHDRLPDLFLEALKLCDSAQAEYKTIIINQRLAEFYDSYGQKDSARYHAYQAKETSKRYHNDDLLKSLLILSKVEEDSMAVEFFKQYIELNDSIQKNERALRDKFFRIRYETNKLEQEKERIARDRRALFISLLAVMFTFVFIYIIITQRAKNKELRLERQQQEANEEIYNLMLSQQDKVEEARTNEKKRISEELHDGILGRLFGTRLSLDSLNMNSSEEAIKTRGTYIDQLKVIEQDIRKVSHDLNTDFISSSGYIDIVKTLVETQSHAYGYKVDLKFDDTIHWDDFSNKTKIHIYRILQESLQNIYKHAKASLVKISFKLKNNVIWLSIEDNGVGFDVTKAKKGIGIKNINSRANEISAKVQINSEKDKGTEIRISIPLD